MLLNRIRWQLLIWSQRHGLGRKRRSLNILPTLLLAAVVLAGVKLLSSIWTVFMNGFLASTPWVPGASAGTYYYDSVIFTLKSTLTIGVVLLLIAFAFGFQISRSFRRR